MAFTCNVFPWSPGVPGFPQVLPGFSSDFVPGFSQVLAGFPAGLAFECPAKAIKQKNNGKQFKKTILEFRTFQRQISPGNCEIGEPNVPKVIPK